MSDSSTGRHVFELDGGRPSLDFVNTISGDRSGRPVEHLAGYSDLVCWAEQAGVISPGHARALLAKARRDPDAAGRVYREAVELRESLHRVWRAVISQTPVGAEDLTRVNAAGARSAAQRQVIEDGGRYCLAWPEEDVLEAPLWPVSHDAVELLTSESSLRLRVCEATSTHECGWIFLDQTKNGTRRWCSMKDCGNRAKARRFQARRGI